jgi:hypothetical protein
MRLGKPNASVRRDPWSGTHKNAPAPTYPRKRPIQADRHPGVRLRHLGSDPAWRGLTRSVGGSQPPLLVTSRANRVYNSFPVRDHDPVTITVKHPNLGSRVDVPVLPTPPLELHSP